VTTPAGTSTVPGVFLYLPAIPRGLLTDWLTS
jgi:hypothetical protein